MNPLLRALRELGGSASIEEINRRVSEIAGLSEDQLQVAHPRGRGSEVDYRLAWTRTYLKAYGLLENSSRGVWSFTPRGREVENVDSREVVRTVASMQRKSRTRPPGSNTEIVEVVPEDDAVSDWREQLMDLLGSMSPGAFERLAQRVLRESGFVQVEVTGRSGDGGIDGNGILVSAF